MSSSPLSRRHFMAIAAATAAGAAMFDLPKILRAADAADPYAGFPVGIQSYSLRDFSLEEAVRHMHGMGIHYTEFFNKHLDPKATDEVIASTKKLLADSQITLIAHGVNGFGKDHEANRKVFDFAKRAGLKSITADPTLEAFDSLDKLVAEYGIRIAIHNHGPKHRYDKLADVQKVLKDRHKLIGACVDTGHVIRTKEDPIKWISELGERVYGCHLKDDIKQDGGSQNVVIGKGNLDLVGVFKALKAIKFPADGALSLEYEANPKNPFEDMKACLAAAREAIAKVA